MFALCREGTCYTTKQKRDRTHCVRTDFELATFRLSKHDQDDASNRPQTGDVAHSIAVKDIYSCLGG